MDIKLNLKNKQKEKLKLRYKQAVIKGYKKVILRISALLSLGDGYYVIDVANILQVTTETIRQWLREFLSGSFKSLQPTLKSGRPPKLTKSQKKEGTYVDASIFVESNFSNLQMTMYADG